MSDISKSRAIVIMLIAIGFQETANKNFKAKPITTSR